MKRFLLTGFLTLGTVLSATAFAQQNDKPSASSSGSSVAKPEVSTFGDWQVRCFSMKSPSPCDMLFATVRKNNGVMLSSVSFAFAPKAKRYAAQIMVPLGVSLADGVVVSAGSYRSPKLTVRRCDRVGCYVEGIADASLIAGLAKHSGATGQLIVRAPGGATIPLLLSLKGFNKAHDAMVAKAKEKVTGAVGGSSARNADSAGKADEKLSADKMTIGKKTGETN